MITCELDEITFERLCKASNICDDNDYYISLVYDMYDNSNIGDAMLFIDNLFQIVRYYEDLEELIGDYELEEYIVYLEDYPDEIDYYETYHNLINNYEDHEIYGDQKRGYVIKL